jgi:hypothetical protein
MDAAQIQGDSLAIINFILFYFYQLVDFFILVRQSLQFEVLI